MVKYKAKALDYEGISPATMGSSLAISGYDIEGDSSKSKKGRGKLAFLEENLVMPCGHNQY